MYNASYRLPYLDKPADKTFSAMVTITSLSEELSSEKQVP